MFWNSQHFLNLYTHIWKNERFLKLQTIFQNVDSSPDIVWIGEQNLKILPFFEYVVRTFFWHSWTLFEFVNNIKKNTINFSEIPRSFVEFLNKFKKNMNIYEFAEKYIQVGTVFYNFWTFLVKEGNNIQTCDHFLKYLKEKSSQEQYSKFCLSK